MNINSQRETVTSDEYFPDGSITRIIFNNFLTYEHMNIYPGPNLNVIVGPNGTGKSTIMCGICLAVGGTPRLLGRSELLADYIKRGSEKGSVKIFMSVFLVWVILQLVVRVNFSRDSKLGRDRILSIVLNRIGSSDYFIDGQKVTQTKLRDVVESYNIQIDNPCTFLAQDKVKSFAEQKLYHLLKNTEKAVGKQLVQLHERIEEMVFKQSPVSHAKCLENRLNSVEGELKTLVPLIENYRRRETMRERIRLLQCKKLYLEYLEAEAIARKKAQYKQAKEKELKKIQKAMLPAKSRLEEQENIHQRHKREEKDAIDKLLPLQKEMEKLFAAESVDEAILSVRKDFEKAKKERDEWEEKLSAARNECNLLEEKLAAVNQEFTSFECENSEIKKEYLEWIRKEEELDKQKAVLSNKVDENNAEIRVITEAIDADQQLFRKKFVVLKGNSMEMKCDQAWQWYESNKEKFRRPVFVPLLFISLVSDDAAVYLENIIARRDLLMFICGCKEDELLLTDKQHPWKINSCIISSDESSRGLVAHYCNLKSSDEKEFPEFQIARFQNEATVPAHLSSLGFRYMASNLYTAPDPVKAYLNNVASLHKIPIGTQRTENRLDEVCEALKNSHRLFLTNSLRVRISISRYSGNLSVRTEALRTALRFLVVHTDLPKNNAQNLNELQKQLAKLKELANEMQLSQHHIEETEKSIAQGRERCRKKMDSFFKKRDARNIISSQLRLKSARVRAIENDKPNLSAAAQKCQKAKEEIITKSFERAEKIAKLLEKRKVLIQDALFATLSSEEVLNGLNELRKQLKCFNEEYEFLSDEIKHAEIAVKLEMQKVRVSKQRLYGLVGIENSYEVAENASKAGEALEIVRKTFNCHAIPDNKEEVELEMAREQGKLDALHSEGEKKDIERFEALTQTKESLAEELDTMKRNVSEWENKLDRMLEEWLCQLESVVARMNQYFSSFFENMGCSGEVHFQKPDDKLDILKYGILVAAKFREGERLRQLTHLTQSGGERSVITMLYILALQKLTVVPFRCVDEINQGMDPKNEKIVFNMIVDMLSSDNDLSKTQYFIIFRLTPKLVPDLKFNEKTKIHCVCSGGKVDKRDSWDVAEFLSSTRNRQLITES